MIPKLPKFPIELLSEREHITEIVFGQIKFKEDFDSIFIFGNSKISTHLKAYEIHQYNTSAPIFITGGNKIGFERHFSWKHGEANESDIIKEQLIDKGVQEHLIITENTSTNSLENVLHICSQLAEYETETMVVVTTSYALGRQLRTLKKQTNISKFYTAPFDISLSSDEQEMTRDNWSSDIKWQSKVWGEYLRNYYYGLKGDILQDFSPTEKIRENLNLTSSST